MITHSVVFRLHRPVDSAARDRLVAALEAFGEAMPHARESHVAADIGLMERDHPRSADIALVLRFDDLPAFERYMVDEDHAALVAQEIKPACEGWWAVQSED
ncbi:MAG TPA: Dabb family protein [Baekduia sp.]|jgi:hypothetical protein